MLGITLSRVCPQTRDRSPADSTEKQMTRPTAGGSCWQARAPSRPAPAIGEGARVPGATAAPRAPVQSLHCPLSLPDSRWPNSFFHPATPGRCPCTWPSHQPGTLWPLCAGSVTQSSGVPPAACGGDFATRVPSQSTSQRPSPTIGSDSLPLVSHPLLVLHMNTIPKSEGSDSMSGSLSTRSSGRLPATCIRGLPSGSPGGV